MHAEFSAGLETKGSENYSSKPGSELLPQKVWMLVGFPACWAGNISGLETLYLHIWLGESLTRLEA